MKHLTIITGYVEFSPEYCIQPFGASILPEKHSHHLKHVRCHVENQFFRPDIAYIVTASVYVLREIHMLQIQNQGITVTWRSYQPDGSVVEGKSMDDIAICENLDEEIKQADRYIDLEMGLKPRQP